MSSLMGTPREHAREKCGLDMAFLYTTVCVSLPRVLVEHHCAAMHQSQ